MGAVGHYLEQEGIPTTQISLVREHTEVVRPPRALWVPFMLGRPLGVPDDPAFQRRVLLAVLRLLEAPHGPLLQDFAEDAPDVSRERDEDGAACPVAFSRPRVAAPGEHALASALAEEVAQLQPWHDLALRQRGAGTFGLSGLAPDAVAAFVVAFLGAQPPQNYRPAQPLALSLKHACDDLRAFYEDAGGAQPGRLSSAEVESWYYFGTVAGEVLRELQRICLKSADESLRTLARLTLIPRNVAHRMQADTP